jgi:hypothetical protein
MKERGRVALTVAYAVYAAAYAFLRIRDDFLWAGWLNLAVQAALDLLTAAVAFKLARRSTGVMRTFLSLVGWASCFGIVSDASYGYTINVRGVNPNSLDGVSLVYQIAYALFLGAWALAWAWTAWANLKVRRPAAGWSIAALVGLLALGAVFWSVYLPLLRASPLSPAAQAFHELFTAAQLLGIVAGLLTLMAGFDRIYGLSFLGFALFVGVDFFLRTQEISSSLPRCIPWSLCGLSGRS